MTANRGTDINPCTRTSPCSTIQKGIDTVGARGVVVTIDTGEYAPFTVVETVG